MTTRPSGERQRQVSVPQKPGGPTSGAGRQPTASANDGERRDRKRRRPRRRKNADEHAPNAIVARVTQGDLAAEPEKAPEEPLSGDELTVMRQHFRFLRDHRKALHLRVNAQEDLLLNEKREPTRRGVCQHLLAKVDRSRVFSAVERLDAAAATRLAEGVLRISPDLDYLLLYLQCVGRSASQQQAISALAQALENIDMARLSQGQIRRVLDLIVELFDDAQRPQVLLGLLDNPAFRTAFDNALRDFPDALAVQVGPVRAVQLVVLRGERNKLGPDMLERGLRLLLVKDSLVLRRCSPGARIRLLERAMESEAALAEEAFEALRGLLSSIEGDGARHETLSLTWAQRLVAAGREEPAKKLLASLAKRGGENRVASRLMEALQAPRWGRIALLRSPRTRRGAPLESGPEASVQGDTRFQRRAGFCLDTLRPVHVLVAQQQGGDGAADFTEAAFPVLPGVAPVWHRGRSPEGKPFIVLPRLGRGLLAATRQRPSFRRDELLHIFAQAAALMSMLADCGWRLPDAHLRRFEISDSAHLWFADPQVCQPGERSALQAEHGGFIADFCRELMESPQPFLWPKQLIAALSEEQSASALALALSRYAS